MNPPGHLESPLPLQPPLPEFGLAANPAPSGPPLDQSIAPRAVWAELTASQRARLRQTARRICQEILHDANHCA
jgi:hypothetical protein